MKDSVHMIGNGAEQTVALDMINKALIKLTASDCYSGATEKLSTRARQSLVTHYNYFATTDMSPSECRKFCTCETLKVANR